MPGLRLKRPPVMPVRSIVPNSITILALCSGLTAIRFAIEDRFEMAVIFVLIAGVFDSIDGRVARLLKGSSKFGAELDSLVDMVNFGVVPGVILYFWLLNDAGGMGWIAVLSLAICTALRLARFNVMAEDPDKKAWTNAFFTGVPAPTGAALCFLPLVIGFAFDLRETFPSELVVAYVILIAALMISRIPTWSLKTIRFKKEQALFVMLGVGGAAAVLFSYPWKFLIAIAAIYFISIPFAWKSWQRHEAADAAEMQTEDTQK